MHYKDFSLLLALDVLLAEGSVARAASRMNLSASAMSRVLGQIRELFDDPILVRAGRNLVPTRKAEALRPRVRQIVADSQALFASDGALDVSRLDRVFTVRATDSFVASFGLGLARLMKEQAPLARVRFLAQGDENVDALREGIVDLDVAVMGETGPEVRMEPLFQDTFVGVVRPSHVLAQQETVTPELFAREQHISASRRGLFHGPLDTALEQLGLTREVSIVVPTFADALLLVQNSDLVASVPKALTRLARLGLYTFALPIDTGSITVSQAWHPRFESDTAHQWLRACVRQACNPQQLP